MANDKRLSILRTGTNLSNVSKNVDKKLSTIMNKVGKDIENKYGIKVYHDNLLNVELYEHIHPNRDKHKLQSKNPKRTGIKPDGKALLVFVNGKRKPLVVSENKKQGDGKDQARGNAIERSSKNIIFLQTWMAEENIIPYVFFCYGKDFEEGSYIVDRIATMTHNYPLNRINLFKDADGLGGVSMFTNEKLENAFSEEEMYKICYEIAERSLLYYKSKYGDENYWKI